ncbi:MAG: acylneuraminate cytidylyltransferase family protein [Candidatus Taylorbacteria bacterium]|nr:acylneuraminate cytidylyltransferase family protein [Candidatus Taylorbacteria bacterium]
MFQSKKIVSLIPLRGGSKSIPHKNIKEIAGRPLCFWALKAATGSKYIDEVWVSTEDKKIKEVVLSLGLNVKIIDRPSELAADNSSTESVMLHFAEHVPFDILNLIQATSPTTTSEDLDKAIEQFFAEGDDSLLTGVLYKKFFWTVEGKALNYDYLKRPRRQEFEGVVHENGAFYLTKKEILTKNKNRLGGKIGIFLLSEAKAVDIDEPADWPVAEKNLLNQIKREEI